MKMEQLPPVHNPGVGQLVNDTGKLGPMLCFLASLGVGGS